MLISSVITAAMIQIFNMLLIFKHPAKAERATDKRAEKFQTVLQTENLRAEL